MSAGRLLAGRIFFTLAFVIVVVGGVSRLGPHRIALTSILSGSLPIGLGWCIAIAWIARGWYLQQ